MKTALVIVGGLPRLALQELDEVPDEELASSEDPGFFKRCLDKRHKRERTQKNLFETAYESSEMAAEREARLAADAEEEARIHAILAEREARLVAETEEEKAARECQEELDRLEAKRRTEEWQARQDQLAELERQRNEHNQGTLPEVVWGKKAAEMCNEFLEFAENNDYPNAIFIGDPDAESEYSGSSYNGRVYQIGYYYKDYHLLIKHPVYLCEDGQLRVRYEDVNLTAGGGKLENLPLYDQDSSFSVKIPIIGYGGDAREEDHIKLKDVFIGLATGEFIHSYCGRVIKNIPSPEREPRPYDMDKGAYYIGRDAYPSWDG